MQMINSLLVLGAMLPLSFAQFPAMPTGLTWLNSQVNSQVTLSYKEIDICEKNPGVKSYSGYVHLPGHLLTDIGGFAINTYFAYFEARQNPETAPLAVYLAGGPGESSMYAALASESGPCYVNINGTDTINNPWSFNNYANVLYIDQPVQAGFSYDMLVNATFDTISGVVTPLASNESVTSVPVNASHGYGIYPSQEPLRTVNNTVQTARALWYFGEHWLSSFPAYNTSSNLISFWGNSYGGYWVPETAVQYSQRLQALPPTHPLKPKNITVDAIGLTNGCVDSETAMAGYPEFAYNNTYGVQFGSEALYEEAMKNLTMPGGCTDLTAQCRAVGEEGDPNFTGANSTVNEVCMSAFYYCALYVISSFPQLNQLDPFDVAIPMPMPCPYYLPVQKYLDTAPVQQALGVPLNFTYDSTTVASNFGFADSQLAAGTVVATGDQIRLDGKARLEYLLARNVKIAFIFGDRDYRCPWTGAERTALATNWTHQADFANAGYQEMQGIQTPVEQGGLKAVVKQYGQFSFSRVLDSGHMVSAYAPETVYRIFERTLKSQDVVTGQQSAANGYGTSGPTTSWGWRNQLPKSVPPTCVVAGQFQDANPWAALGS